MSTKHFLLVCLQVVFIQVANSQYLSNPGGYSRASEGANIGIPGTIGIPGNCAAKAEVLVPNGVFSGGVTELVPNLQFGDVTMRGELPIGGTIKVCGCFPVYGTVAVDGCLPSSGTASVQNCRCSQ